MDEILRGARHLLHLINEILDLAVVESGSFDDIVNRPRSDYTRTLVQAGMA